MNREEQRIVLKLLQAQACKQLIEHMENELKAHVYKRAGTKPARKALVKVLGIPIQYAKEYFTKTYGEDKQGELPNQPR